MTYRIINAQPLRDARRAQGYTQADLGRILDCTQQYVSMIETNGSKCSEAVAARVVDVLKIELGDVFGRTTVEPAKENPRDRSTAPAV